MKKTILICEDDAGMQDAFKLIFERAGYHPIIYADGASLLEDNYELPDIFILDRQLSGMDGLDICRYLKNREASRAIPVIMVSAAPGMGQQATAAGVDLFIEKPFRTRELLDVVSRLTA